jgi:hypothetical protein
MVTAARPLTVVKGGVSEFDSSDDDDEEAGDHITE